MNSRRIQLRIRQSLSKFNDSFRKQHVTITSTNFQRALVAEQPRRNPR